MSDSGATVRQRLRAQINSGEMLVAPGCGDALSARLIEEAGFQVAFMSGFWSSGSRGLLDVGLINLNEMVQNARYIARAIRIPVICDADTGFSDGPIHVRRCVEEFEAAGAAGITLEDQTLLKKCGLREEKSLVTLEAMSTKLRVALASRSDPNLLVIARTDALDAEGLEGAITRGKAYLGSGADLLFIEGFRTESELRAAANEFPGRRLVFNQAPRGYGPQLPLTELDRLGIALVLFPAHLALVALTVQRELLKDLQKTGSTSNFDARMTPVDDFSVLLGEQEAASFEARFDGAEEANVMTASGASESGASDNREGGRE